MSTPLPEITCAEAEPLLPLVADGALDAEADPGLFAHLAGCPDCQEALARHDLITLAIGQGAAAPAPRLTVRHYRLPRFVVWASAAALVVGLGGLALAIRGGSSGTPTVAQREIIRVSDPADPASAPYFLIRDGDRWERVDPKRLDGDADTGAAAREATPVGYQY